jgi:hypothetical protein
MSDLETRKKKENEHQIKSEKFRSTGNKFYKEEHYKDAIAQFLQGLKLTPFDTKLTFNIAQVNNCCSFSYFYFVYSLKHLH